MVLLRLLHRPVGRPLFLPAHGRGSALPAEFRRLLKRRAGVWDLPELPEIGGPLEPEGAVALSQQHAAEAMGVARCWYGVNGATGLLQAALLGLCRPGQSVLLPRNAHRSLIQACLLGQLNPLLFDLPFPASGANPSPPMRIGCSGCSTTSPASTPASAPRCWCIPLTRAMPMIRLH